MKKLITIAIVILVLLTVVHSRSVEPVVEKTLTAIKIDDKTVEVTTITTSTSESPERTSTTISTVVEKFDRAVVKTELDHIPDRKAEIQKQLDAVNEREAELIEILKVFE